jgi:hypothetical protein
MAVTMRADDQKYLLESADRAMTALVDAAVRLGFMTSGAAAVSDEFSGAMQRVENARRILRHQVEVTP